MNFPLWQVLLSMWVDLHYKERTAGAGYAFDFFCKAADNRKITGYVEWESEIPPVPSWCPFYIKQGE